MSTNQLKVIGAGLGRTGTESLKKALEQLGFGTCYHMFELMKNPEHLSQWEKLSQGEKPDYGFLFDGYQSCTDFPAAIYYREFMEHYPEARVVLTVRDVDKWYDSATKTILREMPSFLLAIIRFVGLFSKTAKSLIRLIRTWQNDLCQPLKKRDYLLAVLPRQMVEVSRIPGAVK